jgi:hypothetical protein
MPVYNRFTVNNLAFWHFHGMEEVTGSIPVRSTNQIKHLAPPVFAEPGRNPCRKFLGPFLGEIAADCGRREGPAGHFLFALHDYDLGRPIRSLGCRSRNGDYQRT